MKINTKNWNYSHYQEDELVAFISIGGELDKQGNYCENYLVTLADLDFRELYQDKLNNLEKAIELINSKYKDWQFQLRTKPPQADSGGCGSCEAH